MGAGSSLANRRPVHRRHKPSGQTGTASAPLFGRSVLTVFQSTMSVRFSRTIRVMVTRSRCAFCRSLVSSSIADWTLVSASATTVLDSPTARCSSQKAGVVYKLSTHFLKGLIHRSVSCRPNSSPVGQFQTRHAYWPDPEDARASLRSEGRGK